MGELQHAKLSASGAHRWMNCPAAPSLEAGIPDKGSVYAAEGTAAHELAELCLRTIDDPERHLGRAFNGFEVDHEMVEAVTQYVNYVRDQPGQLMVEQRVSYDKWVPGGFGTADAIVLNNGVAVVADLKYGKGVKVDAENNPQAMLYGLGCLSTLEFLYDCHTIKLVVVQPRLDHISEWEISVEDLLAWAENELVPAAEAADDPNAQPVPGEKQCQFCKAKATCRALAEHSLRTATEGFASIDEPGPLKIINSLTNEEVAAILPQLDLISGWIKAVEAHALAELETGRDVPGYKLVAGRSLRKWDDVDEAEAAMRRAKVKVADMFTRKLVSPAQAEKLLGKEHWIIEKHVIKPDGKPALAPMSDKRPALEINPTDGFTSTEAA